MKRVALVALALIMLMTAVGCSSESEPVDVTEPQPAEQTPAEAELPDANAADGWTVLAEHITNTGTSNESGNMQITLPDSALGDVAISVENDTIRIYNTRTHYTETMIPITYVAIIQLPKDATTFTYKTQFALYDETMESYTHSISAENQVEKAGITSATALVFSMAVDNKGDAVVSDYADAFSNRIHLLLASLYYVMETEGLNISLADIGFTNYTVATDVQRNIIVASLTEEASKVAPAPILVGISDVDHNSAGTTEAYVRFTNTSNKDLVVFNFYVRGYDAYGDLVKPYGHYDYTDCYYDEGLPAGESTPSGWYWDIFGAEEMVTIEAAVYKYKLEGEETVEIPESQLVWASMD